MTDPGPRRDAEPRPERFRDDRPGPGGLGSVDDQAFDVVELLWKVLEDQEAVGDPLASELLTGSFVGVLEDADTPDDVDGLTFAAILLEESAADRHDLRTLVAYRCLAAISDPTEHSFRARADELEPKVGRIPAWVHDLDEAQPSEAELLIDPRGDGTNIYVEYVYPSGDRHSIAVYVDVNMGGLVKDTIVGPHLDEMHEIFASHPEPGMSVEPIDLADARARIEEGYRILDMTLSPPVNEEVWHSRPLIEARLETLPAGGSAPEISEVPTEERARLVEEFLGSTDAAAAIDRHGQEDVRSVAALLVDHASDYVGGDPLRCSPVTVELFMVDWFPRKVLHADELAPSVADTVRAWAGWAGGQKGLPAELVAETVESTAMWEGTLTEGIDDPAAWGPAKAMLTEMLDDGVDPSDEEAVSDWIERFNADPERALPGMPPMPEMPDNVVPFPGDGPPFGGPPADLSGLPGLYDDPDLDAEIEDMLEAQDRADRHAAAVLRSVLADQAGESAPADLKDAAAALRSGYSGSVWPHEYMAAATDQPVEDLLALDDLELVLTSAGAPVQFIGDPGLEPEEQSAVMTLESGDWVALALEVVRRGPGTDMDADYLAELMDNCEEVVSFESDPDAQLFVAHALEIIKPWFEAAGIIDRDDRLTKLGAWVLPRAVCRAFGLDFDATPPTEAEPFDWHGIDEDLSKTIGEILAPIERICEEALDHEYLTLARRTVGDLARHPDRPLRRGRTGLWAAGVLYALGQVNLMFYWGAEPGLAGKDLVAMTGEKQGSVGTKATRIKQLLDLEGDSRYLRWEYAEGGMGLGRSDRIFNF